MLDFLHRPENVEKYTLDLNAVPVNSFERPKMQT